MLLNLPIILNFWHIILTFVHGSLDGMVFIPVEKKE